MIFPCFDLNILTCLPYYIYARVMCAYIFFETVVFHLAVCAKAYAFGLLFSVSSRFDRPFSPSGVSASVCFFLSAAPCVRRLGGYFARFPSSAESRFRRSVCVRRKGGRTVTFRSSFADGFRRSVCSEARSCCVCPLVIVREPFPPPRVCERTCFDLRNFARKIVKKLQK